MTQPDPLVSVVVTFLNSERFLQEAVESVLAQTYSRWELLLVDDGSRDRSVRMALNYADIFADKIRYFEHPGHINLGIPASRNLGIGRSEGVFIAFLDSDDVWLPTKLADQVGILTAHPDVAMVYGPSCWWNNWSGIAKITSIRNARVRRCRECGPGRDRGYEARLRKSVPPAGNVHACAQAGSQCSLPIQHPGASGGAQGGRRL